MCAAAMNKGAHSNMPFVVRVIRTYSGSELQFYIEFEYMKQKTGQANSGKFLFILLTTCCLCLLLLVTNPAVYCSVSVQVPLLSCGSPLTAADRKTAAGQ